MLWVNIDWSLRTVRIDIGPAAWEIGWLKYPDET